MNFDPSPPWVCGNTGPSQYECDYPNVPLWPGESVDLHVSVDLPADTNLCNLTNVAELAWAPGWGDADPSDDAAFANALIPNSKCNPPPGDHTNLKIEKHGLPVCLDKGANWACLYAITVTNTGPGDYTGDIVVHDKLSVANPIAWLPAAVDLHQSRTGPYLHLPASESAGWRRRSSRCDPQHRPADRCAGAQGRAGAGASLHGEQSGRYHRGAWRVSDER